MTQATHLLILHGWNHSAQIWQVAHTQLATTCLTLVIPDLPGFGKQPLIAPDWSIPEYAQWVEQYVQDNILSKNPTAKVIVLGHSFGGRIGSYLAAQNPAWLSHLILYAAPVLYRPTLHTKFKILSYKIVKRLTFGSKLLREFIAHAHHDELKHADANSLGNIYRAVVNFDQTNILPKIKVPTDIIIGTYDTEVRIHIAEESAHLIPHAKLHKLENQSHNIHLDNPTLFYGLIRRIILAKG